MPTQTFMNLSADKQERIQTALLNEFSHYPLSNAQVARIVKEAHIARGAFYKYFADLNDAYQYLFQIALDAVHDDLSTANYHDPQFLIEKMQQFVSKTHRSHYFELFKMHFKTNETLVPSPIQTSTSNMTAKTWMIFTLSHETLRLIFLDEKNQELYLKRFAEALNLIKKG